MDNTVIELKKIAREAGVLDEDGNITNPDYFGADQLGIQVLYYPRIDTDSMDQLQIKSEKSKKLLD